MNFSLENHLVYWPLIACGNKITSHSRIYIQSFSTHEIHQYLLFRRDRQFILSTVSYGFTTLPNIPTTGSGLMMAFGNTFNVLLTIRNGNFQ